MQSRENLIEEKILSDKPKKGRSKKMSYLCEFFLKANFYFTVNFQTSLVFVILIN